MKVNLGVELDDAQRRALATLIKGKPTQKMAGRDEVRDYLQGIVAALWLDDGVATEAAPTLPGRATVSAGRGQYTPDEQAVVEQLLAAGRTPEYARGWISAGRVLIKSGHKLKPFRLPGGAELPIDTGDQG